MSAPLAELVRRMSADGCSSDLIAAAIEAAEVYAQMVIASAPAPAASTTVDSAAERRKAWDRERKRAKKKRSGGIPAENAENSGGIPVEQGQEPPPPPSPPSPPHTPPITPTPTTPTHVAGERAAERSSPRGSPIPADWQPREDERKLADGWGWSPAEFDDQVERFRDYGLSRSGRERNKLDWDRTFRNRMKDVNDARNRRSKPAYAPRDKHSVSAGFDLLDAKIAGRGHRG